jgi:hypothetical protein
MGFFKKLFARESVVDRIARAKQHVAEGDDALAIKVLVNLDEPEALAICEAAQRRLRGHDAQVAAALDAADDDDDDEDAYVDPADSVVQIENLRIQFYDAAVANAMVDDLAWLPLGDIAMMVVADVFGAMHATLTWSEVAKLGLSREAAVETARVASTMQCFSQLQHLDVNVAGAAGELVICNDFYMAGAMLNIHEQLPAGSPFVICPLTWHHWFVFTLGPDATAETITAMRDCVDKIADSITTIHTALAWVTRSLWWWPGGVKDPVVIDLAALPADLQRLFEQALPRPDQPSDQ